MTLDDMLAVERYRVVTDRLKYFTDLARDAFRSYVRLYAAAIAAAVAVISARNSLHLRPETVLYLVRLIAWAITILGVVAAGQIAFCLVKWYGFRRAERQIYDKAPEIGNIWWIFESLYIVAIAVGIVGVWIVVRTVPEAMPLIPPSIGPR